jgi:hypothetical protein
MAVFLVLQRFDPDWAAAAFGAAPKTALQLLAGAVRK